MTSALAGSPPDALATLQEHWPTLPWDTVRETHGAFHQVLLLPPVAALRIRTGAGHESATQREHDIAVVLCGAGLRVPHPLADPLHTQQWSAAAFTHAEGSSRDVRSWAEDRADVLLLLEAWSSRGRRSSQQFMATSAPTTSCGTALENRR